MIPIAAMRYSEQGDTLGSVSLSKGDKVFVLGYVTVRESPMAIVMHPKKGWQMVAFHSLIPHGFRTGGTI